MARDVPRSVVNAVRMLGLIVATSGVITLLIWLMRDEVILGWAEGNPSAQEILAQGGIDQLRDSPIVPGFVALSVVAFVGFRWSRLDAPGPDRDRRARRARRRGLPRQPRADDLRRALRTRDRGGPGAVLLPVAARDHLLPARLSPSSTSSRRS